MSTFACASQTGCVKARHGLDGECIAARLRNPRLCQLADPSHPDYKPGYEEYLKGDEVGRTPTPRPAVLPAPEAEPSPSAPGLLARAASFAGAVAGHVGAGMPKAAAEVRAARLAVCRGCDQLEVKPVIGETCRSCGCILAIKASWAEERCPLGKWGPITPALSPAGPARSS